MKATLIESINYEDLLNDLASLIEQRIPAPAPEKPKSSKLLNQKQLAEALGISKVTVWRMLKRNQLPYKEIRGRKMFDYNEVLASL